MSVANESSAEERSMRHEEHSGPGRYWLVWGALMVLTLLTVVTGRMHLPDFGLLLALVIASVKGTLVLLFFMHLVDHKGANRLVIGVSLLFVVLMLVLPMADLATRFRPANPSGSHLSDMPDLNFPVAPAGAAQGGGAHPAPGAHP